MGDLLGAFLGDPANLTGAFGHDDGPQEPAARKLYEEGKATLDANAALYPQRYALDKQTALDYSQLTSDALATLFKGQREADVSQFEQLGPRTVQALLNADPQQRDLRNSLNQQVYGDLQAGSGLTSAERHDTQQNVRTAQAARGLGYGPSDVYEEAFTLGQAGQARKAARQSNAARLIGINQATAGDPFMAVIGRPAISQGLNANVNATATNDPFTAYSSDLNNTNFNAAWANVINKRNLDQAREAAYLQLAGSIIGAGGSAAGAAI